MEIPRTRYARSSELNLAYQVFGSGTWAGSKASRDPALEELRSRYARGEIDQEEFDRRKRDLA